MPMERLQYLESVKDVKWIVYMEFRDAPGKSVSDYYYYWFY